VLSEAARVAFAFFLPAGWHTFDQDKFHDERKLTQSFVIYLDPIFGETFLSNEQTLLLSLQMYFLYSGIFGTGRG